MNKICAIFSLVLILVAACPVQAQSPNPPETLQQYVADLQANPNDNVLREKIIKLSREMKPELVIPAQAKKFGNRAEYVIKNAKSDTDFTDAVSEYEKALLVAPWVSAYYFNLGVAFEKTGQLESALDSYKFYLLAAPGAQDADDVQKQIDGIEYALEKKEAAAKASREQAVLIPAGDFMMGEKAERKVFVEAFYMDKYEVTVAEYMKFCQETNRVMPQQPDGSAGQSPVANVTLEESAAYAKHYGKRLPTEAEWEKAARAGSTTKYCFGDKVSEIGQYAWYRYNLTALVPPVGSKRPNAFGLYDMHGSVWEYCADNSGGKALRGGGRGNTAADCRSASRIDLDVNDSVSKRGKDIGFRCVLSQ